MEENYLLKHFSRIARLQSATPKKLDNKKDIKRDLKGCPPKGEKDKIS